MIEIKSDYLEDGSEERVSNEEGPLVEVEALAMRFNQP